MSHQSAASFLRLLGVLVFLLLVGWAIHPFDEAQEAGTLALRITDDGRPTPARVELLDEKGQAHIAEDALLVGGD